MPPRHRVFIALILWPFIDIDPRRGLERARVCRFALHFYIRERIFQIYGNKFPGFDGEGDAPIIERKGSGNSWDFSAGKRHART